MTDQKNNPPSIEDLQKQVEEADASAEMKANFLATMSHEIRTPMQSVYGLLELIAEEKPNEKIMAMVNTAKTSASGLLEILDDILDFAKMDADKMELDRFEVPVRTLVRGIMEAISVKVHGQHVQLIDDIAEDVPFVIIGDPKRLRQIIMNLAGNALKFTREGNVTIRVTKTPQHLEPAKKDQLILRFEIIDTGIGMPQNVADKLFQPFTQADNSTSRKFGGTGLGLSICKKLIGLMNGEIGAQSTEGKGSNFWFEIPTEEVGTDTTTVDLPDLSGVSILSVEDHPQGAKEIVRSLSSMGATVESCPTYAEALELVKRRPFDVGVIDQGLPDGLGLDLIREIIELRPFMGLIMYTVRDDVGLQHSLNSLGVEYLSKPASRLGLGETVKDAVNKSAKVKINGPTRLLIAEDTESVRDVLRRQLEKLEIDADFVTNGEEALEALKTNDYGILFTDLHMPNMDGYELTRHIRENEGESGDHFPIVVLTADVQMSARQVYLDHGFDECLLKPVSLGHFRRLLIRWGLLKEQEIDSANTPPEFDLSDFEDKNATNDADNSNNGAACDLAKVKEQMGALDAGTVEMLHLFIEMTAPLMDRLQRAQNEKDYHDLHEAAHSLKGASRSACCNMLGDIADKIQNRADNGEDCTALVQDAIAEFERAAAEIKTIQPE
jgi:two-component system sensor histidine kinase/response regulator